MIFSYNIYKKKELANDTRPTRAYNFLSLLFVHIYFKLH